MPYGSLKLKTAVLDTFRGMDVTSAPDAVRADMSPDCTNMIRDVPGKLRKCMGYRTLFTLPGRVNGGHVLHSATGARLAIHAGTGLYTPEGALLYEGMADAASRSVQLGKTLAIFDGKALILWDGERAAPAAESAYLPTVTISRQPEGGGTPYEDLNLLQPGFAECFLGTAEAREYQLSFAPLDVGGAVKVEKMTPDGGWAELREGADFTVDRTAGRVKFASPPGESPATGEDNLRITARRTVPGYAQRINGCTVGIAYGVGGAADRLFLSGNEAWPGRDWYSGQGDASYWPDTGYSILGTEGAAVTGYSIVGEYLAAHKEEEAHSAVLRSARLEDGRPLFTLQGNLQGPGAVAPGSFARLGEEPMFLTRRGVYAVTTADVNGARFTQNRSYYLDGRLLGEAAMKSAVACVYNNMYWLCTGGRAYILDGLQPLAPADGQPWSNRQYAGFIREGIPAASLWEYEGALWFGRADGGVCRFYSDPQSPESYSDDGRAIVAVYATPDLFGQDFASAKTFWHFSVLAGSAPRAGVWAKALLDEEEKELFEHAEQLSTFGFSRLKFSRLRFGWSSQPRWAGVKLRLRNQRHLRFCVGNSEARQPFYLKSVRVQYDEKYTSRRT